MAPAYSFYPDPSPPVLSLKQHDLEREEREKDLVLITLEHLRILSIPPSLPSGERKSKTHK